MGDGFGVSVDTYLLEIDAPLVRTVKSGPSAVVMRATLTKFEYTRWPEPPNFATASASASILGISKTIEVRRSRNQSAG